MKFNSCSIEHLMPKQRIIPLKICFFGHSCIPAAFQHFYFLYFLSIMLHKLPITTRCHSQPKAPATFAFSDPSFIWFLLLKKSDKFNKVK